MQVQLDKMNTAAGTRLTMLKIESILKANEEWGSWKVLVLDRIKTHQIGGFVDPLHKYSFKNPSSLPRS